MEMSANPGQILGVLSEIIDPNTRQALPVTAKNCEVVIEGTDVSITVPLGYPSHNGESELKKRIETALGALGLSLKRMNQNTKIISHAVQPGLRPLPTVRNIIAVASGRSE